MRIARLLVCACLLGPPAAGTTLKIPVWLEEPRSSIQVTVGGKPVEVLSVQTPDDDLILLIVMDTVNHLDRTDAAREALVEKLGSLGPRYFAGVLSAQDGLLVRLDPTHRRERLLEELAAVEVRGVPGLLDVVEQASRIADHTLGAAKVRVAVLFITDGEVADYRGDYTIPIVNPSDRRDLSRRFRNQLILTRVRAIADTLKLAQAPLFFLHLARQNDDLNEVYQNGIRQFATVTGGEAVFAQSLQEIPFLVERLLDRIATHSVISLEAACNGLRRLEIRASEGAPHHPDRIGCSPDGS